MGVSGPGACLFLIRPRKAITPDHPSRMQAWAWTTSSIMATGESMLSTPPGNLKWVCTIVTEFTGNSNLQRTHRENNVILIRIMGGYGI
jgi:hypothetical protein